MLHLRGGFWSLQSCVKFVYELDMNPPLDDVQQWAPIKIQVPVSYFRRVGPTGQVEATLFL